MDASALRVGWILAAVLGALAGCGGSTEPKPSDGGFPDNGCGAAEGAFQLAGSGFPGDGPWILIQTQETGCRAVVACSGHPARAYRVTSSPDALTLEPTGDAAVGGSREPTQFHLTHWNRIDIELEGGTVADSATANLLVEWSEEDIGSEDPMTADLTVGPPQPATIAQLEAILPWRRAELQVSRPVEAFAPKLGAPAGWSFEDQVIDDAPGVITAEAWFSGSWDDVRGATIALDVDASLADLGGMLVDATDVEVAVLDVGPAVQDHDMSSTDGLATWGNVQPYDQGACAGGGCLLVKGVCGQYAGVAGQLRVDGKSELSLVMHVDGELGEWVNIPYLYRVEVVVPDGSKLEPTSGGSFDGNNAQALDATWTYDVSGLDLVGFSVEAASYCHGWGGPIIVDAVRAQ